MEEIGASLFREGVLWLVAGPRGCGKTQLGTELGRLALRRGETVQYARAQALWERVLSCRQGASEETTWMVYTELCGSRLLVLDALEERGPSEAEDRWLSNLLCERFDRGRDSVLLTNEDLKVAVARLGDSVVSRIGAGAVVTMRRCLWGSFRDMKGQE
jgi:chromosomal replication initiation ATPase DnaA